MSGSIFGIVEATEMAQDMLSSNGYKQLEFSAGLDVNALFASAWT
jgi:hypothetical protein